MRIGENTKKSPFLNLSEPVGGVRYIPFGAIWSSGWEVGKPIQVLELFFGRGVGLRWRSAINPSQVPKHDIHERAKLRIDHDVAPFLSSLVGLLKRNINYHRSFHGLAVKQMMVF